MTYAAHTLDCNTGAIGVALAGMKGAVEAPFSAGLYPINELQLRAAAQLVADLCRQYGIPATPTTVLTHAEVQRTLGVAQRGKWDIARLTLAPGSRRSPADRRPYPRARRGRAAAGVYQPAPIALTGHPEPEPGGILALFLAALRGFFRKAA